jgi:hypothetical protein
VSLIDRKKGFNVYMCKNWLTNWHVYDIILNCQNARFFAFTQLF